MNILILGGNRFFGKKLSQILAPHHELSILNRGTLPTPPGVQHICCDRDKQNDLLKALSKQSWDIVYDHSCYDAKQAQQICQVLQGRCQRYVFISSQSVYPQGGHWKEENFQAQNYPANSYVPRTENYAEAKRQAEAVFAREATFPVVCARFPIVLGEDDYTRRLHFHIERNLNDQEIHVPNAEALISFIHSSDAAQALAKLAESSFNGPLNLASKSPIALQELFTWIEKQTTKKFQFSPNPSNEDASPFGIKEHWTLDVSKQNELGIESRDLSNWLPTTIENLVTEIKQKPY